jgi:hypothetical protein
MCIGKNSMHLVQCYPSFQAFTRGFGTKVLKKRRALLFTVSLDLGEYLLYSIWLK